MKILAMIYCVLLFSLVGEVVVLSSEAQKTPIPDYKTGLDLAQKEEKRVFLVFSAKWCGPCQRFKVLLEQRNIQIKLENYVYIALDIDVKKNEQIVSDFGINTIPAYYMLIFKDGKWKINKKGIGLPSEGQLLEFLE